MESQKTQQVNTSENLEQLQNEVNQKISEMLANSNFKDLLEKYVLNVSEIGAKTNELSTLRELRKSIIDFKNTINTLIQKFSDITPIETIVQQKEIVALYKKTLGEINYLAEDNKKIKDI